MDTPLTSYVRHEYLHTEENVLAALRQYKRLTSYPAVSDRHQQALHARLEQLAAKGLVVREKVEGPTVRWRSAL